MYSNATVDPRVRRYLDPASIVWSEGALERTEVLLQPGSGQATVWARPGALIPAGGAILLDFGVELHGGVQIVSRCSKDNKVLKIRLRFGESVAEAMGVTNNDHAMHDSVLDIPPMGTVEFGNTGFRYVRIDAIDGVEIQFVRAVALYRDLEYRGSFECDDERLNKIWSVGAYTVHLCLQDYVWDGIKRDRLVWIGDLFPEAMVAAAVFGKTDVVERSLDLSRDETPLPKYMNGIASYSLWWVINHDAWYMLHGDLKYLKAQRGYLLGLLRHFQTLIDESGSERIPHWRFLDWSTNGQEPALHEGLQALMAMSFDAGARLCSALKEGAMAKSCVKSAELLRSRQPGPSRSKQSCALQVLAGMLDPSEANSGCLSVEPSKGISTFFGYVLLEARAKAGDYRGCLDLIREYWGGMLDMGATTFWEHFEMEWMQGSERIDQLPKPGARNIHRDCGAYCFQGLRHSLCHGWAGGPTAWLSEHVLGVKPLKPGFKAVSVEPRLAGLAWAKGSVPTPYGEISVDCRKGKGGKLVTDVKAPREVKIVS